MTIRCLFAVGCQLLDSQRRFGWILDVLNKPGIQIGTVTDELWSIWHSGEFGLKKSKNNNVVEKVKKKINFKFSGLVINSIRDSYLFFDKILLKSITVHGC